MIIVDPAMKGKTTTIGAVAADVIIIGETVIVIGTMIVDEKENEIFVEGVVKVVEIMVEAILMILPTGIEMAAVEDMNGRIEGTIPEVTPEETGVVDMMQGHMEEVVEMIEVVTAATGEVIMEPVMTE